MSKLADILLQLLLYWLLHWNANVQAETTDHRELCEDACDSITCGSKLHTLFSNTPETLQCPSTSNAVFRISTFKSLDLKSLLIVGHNGLRDRIAQRMKVSNMLELAWNNQLENMAFTYLLECDPFKTDPCTDYNITVEYKTLFKAFISGKDAYKFVVQNRYCITALSFPLNFVEMALRSWYFDKTQLKPPIYQYDNISHSWLGIIYGENNFTHLAYPLTTDFGCSFARYEKLYCLFCNYVPYYHCPPDGMLFDYGEEASFCPSFYPLKSEYFPGLCTGGRGEELGLWGGAMCLKRLKTKQLSTALSFLAIFLSYLFKHRLVLIDR